MDIVLQGGVHEYTLDVANFLLTHDFIENVIISTWYNEDIKSNNANIHILKNNKPENRGIGNRNLQIVSTLNGLKLVKSDMSAKLRTDIFVSSQSLYLIDQFVNSHIKNQGEVFTIAMFPNQPFHPGDHIFWGRTQDLIKLFDIPLDNIPPEGPYGKEYSDSYVHCETYIGMYYYALFDDRVKEFIKYPEKYLNENAPLRYEAMKVYKELYDKVFIPLPKIDVKWATFPFKGSYFYQIAGDYHGR